MSTWIECLYSTVKLITKCLHQSSIDMNVLNSKYIQSSEKYKYYDENKSDDISYFEHFILIFVCYPVIYYITISVWNEKHSKVFLCVFLIKHYAISWCKNNIYNTCLLLFQHLLYIL